MCQGQMFLTILSFKLHRSAILPNIPKLPKEEQGVEPRFLSLELLLLTISLNGRMQLGSVNVNAQKLSFLPQIYVLTCCLSPGSPEANTEMRVCRQVTTTAAPAGNT